ncbi:MAG: hypothetical protein AAF399_27920 [Bacteroidota bacterium]
MSKYLFIFSIVIIDVIGAYFHRAREAHYIYMGKYDYEVVDETLFSQTYLSESYGFLIGDLSIQGLQIKDLPHTTGQKST